MLNISGLGNGIVIDHIKAGKAMDIYHYLKLDKAKCTVAIIMNAKSNKMGQKDIIKIDGPIKENINMLAVLDDQLTINIIEKGEIVIKKNPVLPTEVTNIIKCKNPRCITSIEQELPHVFKLTNKEKRIYRCIYCEEAFERQ
ncbi:MAG: aspartate carbamoyltransferase regulatory subunit [bacterium]|nr:aspartate carbamoyltransferase regulatory subunit [bacterium]